MASLVAFSTRCSISKAATSVTKLNHRTTLVMRTTTSRITRILFAINTSALTPSLAFTSLTTVPAPGTPNKKRSSLQKDNVSAYLVVDSVLVKRRERLNWHEKAYCEAQRH